MGDPFLRSPDNDATEPPADDDLLRRSGLPRAVFDHVPRHDIERFVTRVESWEELAADIDRSLVSAGFHRHDPSGAGGGFAIATWLYDHGIVVSWALRGRMDSEPDPFEDRIEGIMNPALAAVLTECGFAAELIPADQDDAGCVFVTGLTDPPS